MRKFIVEIRGPQRYMRYRVTAATSVDAALDSTNYAQPGDRVKVVLAAGASQS